MLAIKYVSLHRDSQPDFEVLKKKGWVHPIGFDARPREDTLEREFSGTMYRVVKHQFKDKGKERSYAEIFLSPSKESKKSGVAGVCKELKWLEKELKYETKRKVGIKGS